jgi:hypothetical protein
VLTVAGDVIVDLDARQANPVRFGTPLPAVPRLVNIGVVDRRLGDYDNGFGSFSSQSGLLALPWRTVGCQVGLAGTARSRQTTASAIDDLLQVEAR